ncbi:MAG: PspC domain-containing protein [Lachnospiraceae bacterium]|nr:PspC domain-containing protein [Lachnospiraceae bacterium]
MKKLYRSRTDRIFLGVCGGIGEYLEIDPTVIRLLAVILGFTGSGIVAYIVAAILMPEQ